jgi:ribonuclease E
MTKRMLIDATHAEETRVVVLDGNRLEDFDVETSAKRQLKGNIYLAKVVKVEPSLQAAFVEYGGNRHGFLAFDEIHPDYYQMPVADRERLLELQAEQARAEDEAADRDAEAAATASSSSDGGDETWGVAAEPGTELPAEAQAQPPPADAEAGTEPAQPLAIEPPHLRGAAEPEDEHHARGAAESEDEPPHARGTAEPENALEEVSSEPVLSETDDESGATAELLAEVSVPGENGTEEAAASVGEASAPQEPDNEAENDEDEFDHIPESPPPETIGGEHDVVEESRERRIPYRFLRNYRIQEVIRRRQILLVQVVKEERGTKGAALTTYISLAGRYCVLMPNSPRGGGISRKITSVADRRRLKEVMAELDLPPGMGLIVRTAGANRPKPEIKRDCEYLLRLWDDIREHTMHSVAPALIYEEASLIKRAIRDVYSRDIDEIIVDGEDGWRAARDFMRMLMPSHVKKVQLWRDSGAAQPLFARYQVDAQLDAMLSPTVQLRSGGYLVINQAEALVAIDVNSGRSTRERGIEETALRTNLEAADEVARQLRLRDLAGLIVIDFIDMELRKHNSLVERRMKEALKSDRARIQLGHISHFGLLEMSRQRLRPSLAETSFVTCPHCAGTGHIRSTESAAIHMLRGIEEEAAKRRAAEILVHAAAPVVMYVFNHKRDRLSDVEARYGMRVMFAGDESPFATQFRIDRLRAQVPSEAPAAITAGPGHLVEPEPEEEEDELLEEDAEQEFEEAEAGHGEGANGGGASEGIAPPGETPEESERRRRRRRRRRRGGRREEAPAAAASSVESGPGAANEPPADTEHVEGVPEHAEATDEEDAGNRRRGRRGGRRRPRDDEDALRALAEPGAQQPDLPPIYVGPTPADPFGGHAFDIFDVLEQAEAQEKQAPAPPVTPLPIVAGPPPAIEPVEDIELAPEATPPDASLAEGSAEPTPVSEVPPTEPLAPPEPPAPANDQEAAPAIRPILIGAEEAPPVEKKRGWWRR